MLNLAWDLLNSFKNVSQFGFLSLQYRHVYGGMHQRYKSVILGSTKNQN